MPIGTVLQESLRQPVLDAGAEAVIVLQGETLADCLAMAAPEGIDAAFKAVGGPQITEIAEAMRPRGTIVVHGALSNEPTLALRKSLCLRGYLYTEVTEDPASLARAQRFLTDGIAGGHIAPRIDRCFMLDEIAAAHAYLEDGRHFGKVVVLTDADS